MSKSSRSALFLTLYISTALPAQQAGDVNFNPPIEHPVYAHGEGPKVLIDEAHQNFHTVDRRYRAFADLLRRDGYVVDGLASRFTRGVLQGADILVIANALAEENVNNWSLPTPSAFSEAEVKSIQAWVDQGGSLLLIADHMPFPGAAEQLAASFGVVFNNGYAFKADSSGLMQFRTADGSLQDHPISRGRNASEAIDVVTSFTGQAFRVQRGIVAQPLMILDNSAFLLLPVQAWQFSEQTPHISAGGMLQGAALRVGAGRVAVFGEAAMFTAQVSGTQRRPMGMNHPDAPRNAQFVLNVLHWLSGLLPDE